MFRILSLLFTFSLIFYVPAQETAQRIQLKVGQAPFFHGVASGDPLSDAVIIWTRVTPPNGQIDSIEVSWHIAKDINFTEVVNFGRSLALAENDFTVKIDACGLEPSTHYYYMFEALGMNSLTGLTKTAPDSDRSSLKFAVVSCSRYTNGYFNAYWEIANEHLDIDAWIHLGDYIYENGGGGTGGTISGRDHEPTNEIISISDYRTRHSQHKLDFQLNRLHQLSPCIATWDDHEFTNNSYTDGADNHNAGEGLWVDRKAYAAQAYKEWMPLRNPDPNDDLKIWRTLPYGNLADLIVMDTRIWDRDEPDILESGNNNHSMIGNDQFNWLENSLSGTGSLWKIMCQQVMMAPLGVTIPLVGSVGVNADQWDGYSAQRDRLINYIENNNLDNNVVLTGDIHTFFANEIPGNNTGSAAVEFIVGSVTTPNAGLVIDQLGNIVGPLLGTTAESAVQFFNPHIKFLDLNDHGYVILTIDSSQAQADYYSVDKTSLNYSASHLTSQKVDVGTTSLDNVGSPLPSSTLLNIPDTVADQTISMTKLPDTLFVSGMENSLITDCLIELDSASSVCPNSSIQIFNNNTIGNFNLTDYCFSYAPPANYYGEDSVAIEICDNLGCDTVIVHITVNGMASLDTVQFSIFNDEMIDTCLVFNDIAGVIDTTITSFIGQGSLNVNDSCLNYVPPVGFEGVEEAAIVLCDEYNICDTLYVVINVVDDSGTEIIEIYSDPGELESDCYQFDDLLGPADSISLVYEGTNGIALLFADSCFSYTSNANFLGVDSLWMVACDALDNCDTVLYLIYTEEQTNINEVQDFAILSIHPNPFDQEILIQTYNFTQANFDVTVYDTQGKIVIEKELLLDEGLQYVQIMTDDWAKGGYILELKTRNNTYTKQLIKL